MIELKTTENKTTGKRFYFIDGKRVSYENATFASILYSNKDCFWGKHHQNRKGQLIVTHGCCARKEA